jgi:hypothetical protein
VNGDPQGWTLVTTHDSRRPLSRANHGDCANTANIRQQQSTSSTSAHVRRAHYFELG